MFIAGLRDKLLRRQEKMRISRLSTVCVTACRCDCGGFGQRRALVPASAVDLQHPAGVDTENGKGQSAQGCGTYAGMDDPAVCLSGMGRRADIEYAGRIGLPLRILSGFLPAGILCILT